MSIPADHLPKPAPGGRLRLLDGVRVVDLTTSLAGPYATMLLADLGAEVIKIERPKVGDDSRQWRPPSLGRQSLWYASVNRNKRSVTLDYAQEAGAALLRALIRDSDVVITNQLPKVQAKLGIDWRSVQAVKPDIVFVSLTGFGLEGARADLPCYDLIAEGYSGVMDLTGEADGAPQKVGTPAADLLAGTDAALGCLAALFDRRATGRGHVVDVALVDSMTRFMTPRIVSYLGGGGVPARSGAKDSVVAVYQVFPTADDPITLGLANDNTWRRFCRAVGRTDWLDDPELADNAGRVRARVRLVEAIKALLLEKGRDHWLLLFQQEKIPAGPINRIDQLAADPELQGRGLFYAIHHAVDGGGVAMPQVGLGIRIDHRAAGYDVPPPDLGQDTDAILSGLPGCTPAHLDQLRSEGVI